MTNTSNSSGSGDGSGTTSTTPGGGGGGGVGGILERPMPPFMSSSGSYTNLSSGRASPVPGTTILPSPGSEHKLVSTNSSVSLSVNYLPSKFSSTMINPGNTARRRKNGRKGDGGEDGGLRMMTKMGGGVDAFRNGEARMAVEGDEDYDGVNLNSGSWFTRIKGRSMRWNRFKWTLFFANIVVRFIFFHFSIDAY